MVLNNKKLQLILKKSSLYRNTARLHEGYFHPTHALVVAVFHMFILYL